jgi:hypothetical protein
LFTRYRRTLLQFKSSSINMRTSIILLAFVAALVECSRLTPPVLPLLVRNPYLSIWLPNVRQNQPWAHWPMFWTGESIGFSVLVKLPASSTIYPLLGRPQDSLPVNGYVSPTTINSNAHQLLMTHRQFQHLVPELLQLQLRCVYYKPHVLAPIWRRRPSYRDNTVVSITHHTFLHSPPVYSCGIPHSLRNGQHHRRNIH